MTELMLARDFEAVTRDAWMVLVQKALKGGDFEKRMVSKTADGIRIDPLYTRTDALSGADKSAPGAAPCSTKASASCCA